MIKPFSIIVLLSLSRLLNAQDTTSQILHWNGIIFSALNDTSLSFLKQDKDNCNDIGGENTVRAHTKIKQISDLSIRDLKKIKRGQAKFNVKMTHVFLDLNHVQGYVGRNIYYIWAGCEQKK